MAKEINLNNNKYHLHKILSLVMQTLKASNRKRRRTNIKKPRNKTESIEMY